VIIFKQITANQVYAEAKRIESEILAIMKHRNRKSMNKIQISPVHFKARHVWQKTYADTGKNSQRCLCAA